MAGSDHSGQDMEAGRTNRAEGLTRIWAQQEGDDPFNGDVIFVVEAAREIEDEDFKKPTTTFHGIVGSGVREGAGVIGLSSGPNSNASEKDIPRVSNVGVFGKGPTGVAGEGLPGVEGLGAVGRAGVAGVAGVGAGVVGQGGRRREGPDDARLLHGTGVMGFGGGRPRELPSEQVAGSVGVYGQGAEGGKERRPGAGVVGRGGGPGVPGVVGLTSSPLGLPTMFDDPIDVGVFGRGATGVIGIGTSGPGVHGVGGPSAISDVNPEELQPGVFGLGGSAWDPNSRLMIYSAGVVGRSGEELPLPFKETGHTGVYGVGKTGVKGVGSDGRGGVFVSEHSAQVQLIPRQGPRIVQQEAFIPTVASEPGRFGPPLPRAGSGGDLMTITDDQDRCTLWFCVHGGTSDGAARWAQVLLGPLFDGRE